MQNKKSKKECLVCDRIFKNTRGLKIHKSKIHCKIESKKIPSYCKIITKSKDEYCIKNIDEIFNYNPIKDLDSEIRSNCTDFENLDVRRKKKIIKIKNQRFLNG